MMRYSAPAEDLARVSDALTIVASTETKRNEEYNVLDVDNRRFDGNR